MVVVVDPPGPAVVDVVVVVVEPPGPDVVVVVVVVVVRGMFESAYAVPNQPSAVPTKVEGFTVGFDTDSCDILVKFLYMDGEFNPVAI